MIRIEFQDQAVRSALRRLQAAGDLRPAYQDIGEYMLAATKKRFATGTAPDGTAWRPNSAATLARLGRAISGGKKPLIGETKRLSNEIHYRAEAGGVTIGSSLKYAAVQQFGARQGQFGRTKRNGPIPWGDIPARPFLGVSAEDGRAIGEIVTDFLRDALGR